MIGIYGGTGFYELLEQGRTQNVDTPYGPPSAAPMVGHLGGTEVAFIPRHGLNHEFPPHKIKYRANAWAMKELGVDRIIGPCAAGSLVSEYEPGHFVIPDQLADRTWGRESTFYDGPTTAHVGFADPYCAELRPLARDACQRAGATVHYGGANVIIQGPRFSTRAESKWFAAAGFKVINMTQLPEAYLARELEICYVNIAMITDYDVGVEGEHEPVTHAAVIEMFEENIGVLKLIVADLAGQAVRTARECECATAMSAAEG